MKLLRLCGAIAIVTGVAAIPHVAKAQALGEAATLGAGVSSAGSASGSSLGSSIGRAMESAGHRMASNSKASTGGGVINVHWSRKELERSDKTMGTRAKDKGATSDKTGQPDFVIFGADSEDQDADTDAGANPDNVRGTQPKAANHKGPSGKAGPKKK